MKMRINIGGMKKYEEKSILNSIDVMDFMYS